MDRPLSGRSPGWSLVEFVVATGLVMVLAAAVISAAWAVRRTVEARAERRAPRAIFETVGRCVADLEQAFDPGTGKLLEMQMNGATTQLRMARLGASDDDPLRTPWWVEWIAVSSGVPPEIQLCRIARPLRGGPTEAVTQTVSIVWREWSVQASDGTNYWSVWPPRDGAARPESVRLQAAVPVGRAVYTTRVEVVMRAGRSATSQYERHASPRLPP